MGIIHCISFISAFRVFKPGDLITFRPGVNLIVGEQGSGKSSMYKMLVDFVIGGETKSKFTKDDAAKICNVIPTGPCKVAVMDFEKGNPRILSYFNHDDIQFQMSSLFSSHGECVNGLIKTLQREKEEVPTTFIMDEPDMALSIRSIYKLIDTLEILVANGHQLIANVHNPLLIASQPEVYDMAKREWMTSKKFIASMTPKKSKKKT